MAFERCYCGALDCPQCFPHCNDELECPACGNVVFRYKTDKAGLCPKCSDKGLEKCDGCGEWKEGVEDYLCPECRGEEGE